MSATSSDATSPGSARCVFRMLGPVECTVDGASVGLGRGLRELLFVRLALAEHRLVPAEVLISDLWQGRDAARDPVKSLHSSVWRLRRTLNDAKPGLGECIESADLGYRLDASVWVDAEAFRSLLHEPPDASAEARLASATAGLALWRGPISGRVREAPALAAEVADLERQRCEAVERRCELLLGLGRNAEAVTELERHTQSNPYREGAWCLLMEALYCDSRQAEALRVFRTVQDLLVDELGADPGPQLIETERRILQHDPALIQRCRTSSPFGRGVPPPLAATSLVGRAYDVEQISRLLDSHQLVTIAGPPGSGKTRLAIEVCSGAVDGPLWWADFGTITDSLEVPAAIATAVGVTAAAENLLDAVAGRLEARSGIIVFDNAEHLVSAVGEASQWLLARVEGLRILVTSRVHLDLPTGAIWSVAGLETPPDGASLDDLYASDAVRLFLDRARAAAPAQVIEGKDLAAVAHVVRALDGLPLAIEVAASRVRSVTVDDLAQNLPVLTRKQSKHGGRAALRSALDWSWSLLEEGTARILERISIFAGPFGLAEAHHFDVGMPADTVDRLDELITNSLLVRVDHQPGTGKPYRLLATVRDLGEQRLREQGEWHATALRHFELMEEITRRGSSTDIIAARFELLAALRRCEELGKYSEGVAMLVAVRTPVWLQKELAPHAIGTVADLLSIRQDPTRDRALGLVALATRLTAFQHWGRCVEVLEEGLAVCRAIEWDIGTARSQVLLAHAHWGVGNLSAATEMLERSEDIVTASGDDFTIAGWNIAFSKVRYDEGHHREADLRLQEGLARAQAVEAFKARSDDWKTVGGPYSAMLREVAWRAIRARDPDAHALLEDAEAIVREFGWFNGATACAVLRGELFASEGRGDAAVAQLEQALIEAIQTRDVAVIAAAMEALAPMSLAAGRLDEALSYLRRAAAIRQHHRVAIRPADAVSVNAVREELQRQGHESPLDAVDLEPWTTFSSALPPYRERS